MKLQIALIFILLCNFFTAYSQKVITEYKQFLKIKTQSFLINYDIGQCSNQLSYILEQADHNKLKIKRKYYTFIFNYANSMEIVFLKSYFKTLDPKFVRRSRIVINDTAFRFYKSIPDNSIFIQKRKAKPTTIFSLDAARSINRNAVFDSFIFKRRINYINRPWLIVQNNKIGLFQSNIGLFTHGTLENNIKDSIYLHSALFPIGKILYEKENEDTVKLKMLLEARGYFYTLEQPFYNGDAEFDIDPRFTWLNDTMVLFHCNRTVFYISGKDSFKQNHVLYYFILNTIKNRIVTIHAFEYNAITKNYIINIGKLSLANSKDGDSNKFILNCELIPQYAEDIGFIDSFLFTAITLKIDKTNYTNSVAPLKLPINQTLYRSVTQNFIYGGTVQQINDSLVYFSQIPYLYDLFTFDTIPLPNKGYSPIAMLNNWGIMELTKVDSNYYFKIREEGFINLYKTSDLVNFTLVKSVNVVSKAKNIICMSDGIYEYAFGENTLYFWK